MALKAPASVAVAKNPENDAHKFWIFVGFPGRAGLPDGLDVLSRSKGRECGLDVQVVMADTVNNVDLLDDLVCNAVETRLARFSVFAASVWLPSGVSFGDRQLRGVCVPDVYGMAGLSPDLKAKVRMCTLAAGMKAHECAGGPWLLVTTARRADQPLLRDIPEVAAACGPRPHLVQTSEFEVRSSHQLSDGAEQACTLNTYLASTLVSFVHAQQNGTPATSLCDAWVRTGRWLR